MKIPTNMAWLFWDVDVSRLDTEVDDIHILARVLERGRMAEVEWLLGHYGEDRIRRFFEENCHPEISGRTRSFWRAFFKTEGKTWARPAAFRDDSSIPWPV